jgi:hypothetical protein
MLWHEESWSEWQDLNLRPPRPERGARPKGLAHKVAAVAGVIRPGSKFNGGAEGTLVLQRLN